MKPDYVSPVGSPLDKPLGQPLQRTKKPKAAAPLMSKDADLAAPCTPAKFDKVAYQREYMRKRRAAEKAAKL